MTTQTFKISRTYPTNQYQNWLSQTEELIDTIPQSDNVFFWGAKGNGITNDTVAIQNAINANSELFFPPGTFLITDFLTLKSNFCMFGEATIQSIDTVNGLGMIRMISLTNVCIEGLTLKKKSLTVGAASIYMSNCTNCRVENVKTENQDALATRGINLFGCSKCIITKCYSSIASAFYDPSVLQLVSVEYHGIFIGNSCTDVLVSENFCFNTGVGISVQTFSTTSDINNIIVQGNIIRNCGHYGMMSYRLNSEIYDVVFANNSVTTIWGTFFNTATGSYTHGAGIYLQGCTRNTVIGNTVKNVCILTNSDTLAPGGISSILFTSSCSIVGNTVSDSARYGIITDGTLMNCVGNNVSNCTFSLIYHREGDNINISENILKYDTPTTGHRGVYVTSTVPCNYINITSNNMRNCYFGVLLEDAHYFSVKGNVIYENSVPITAGFGIVTDATCNQGVIDGNIIKKTGGFGVRNLGDFISVLNNVTNGTAANQAIVNGSLTNNNYGTNITDTANTSNATGVVTIASGNNIVLPYCMNENLWIVITGTTQINTIALPSYKRANMTINIVGPIGLVLANNTAGTGLVLLNTSGANITIATANIEVISYRCNGTQWVQF
jgi:parallel beta-helix repeat protein